MAIIFEFTGAIVLGRVITGVIAGGIANIKDFQNVPEVYAYGELGNGVGGMVGAESEGVGGSANAFPPLPPFQAWSSRLRLVSFGESESRRERGREVGKRRLDGLIKKKCLNLFLIPIFSPLSQAVVGVLEGPQRFGDAFDHWYVAKEGVCSGQGWITRERRRCFLPPPPPLVPPRSAAIMGFSLVRAMERDRGRKRGNVAAG
jgi:hypothetical protein